MSHQNIQPEMPIPDTPQLLLEHHLKALRLPTMLREYDMRGNAKVMCHPMFGILALGADQILRLIT